jgi:hypothetical protein
MSVSQKLKELKNEAQSLTDRIKDIKQHLYPTQRKIHWITGSLRYGDLVELPPPPWSAKTIPTSLVVTDALPHYYAATVIKQDGKLGKRVYHIADADVAIVGRYDKDDLPPPDEYAQFGLDNPPYTEQSNV